MIIGTSRTKSAAFGLAAVFAGMLAVDGNAQGANCQGYTDAQITSANAGLTPNVCRFDSTANENAKTNIKHVLLMDWSNGGHDKTHTQRHMLRLSRKYGFKLDRSQSNSYITAATLQGVDLIVFNNGDQDPLSNSTSLAAVRNFVEVQGKGMLAVHAALAYITCANENMSSSDCRWFLRAYRTQFWSHNPHQSNTAARVYVDSVNVGEVPPNALGVDIAPSGGIHGWRNPQLQNIFNPISDIVSQNLPFNGGTGPLATSRRIWEGAWDEWYNYRNHPRREGPATYGGVNYGRVFILVSLDETSQPSNVACSSGGTCKTGDRPISWTRSVGLGLAAYNNAGHGDVYTRSRTVTGGTANDSLWEKYNWRLMKYLARDYVGCMETNNANYNPQASVLSINEIDTTQFIGGQPNPLFRGCAPGTGIKAVAGNYSLPGIKLNGKTISIPVSKNGTYAVAVTKFNGRQVYFRNVEGAAGRTLEVPGLSKGMYVLRVKTPEAKTSISTVAVR